MSLKNVIHGKLVTFTTTDGFDLHGFLQGKKGAKTCVLYVHGMGGNFYRHKLTFIIAEQILKKDFGFFTLNTRGHDAIAKFYGKQNKMFAGTNLEKFEDCVADIKGALRALRKLGFKRFVLCGHSTGCQKISYYQYKTKDKSVVALVLLAPADDYHIQKKGLGKKWHAVVRICKALVKQRKANETRKEIPSGFSAQRFLSIADLKRVESRLFNYDSDLKEFGTITIPILAVFGSKEEYAVKPVKKYMKILQNKTHSKAFTPLIIPNADHGFKKHEQELAQQVQKWLVNIL